MSDNFWFQAIAAQANTSTVMGTCQSEALSVSSEPSSRRQTLPQITIHLPKWKLYLSGWRSVDESCQTSLAVMSATVIQESITYKIDQSILDIKLYNIYFHLFCMWFMCTYVNIYIYIMVIPLDCLRDPRTSKWRVHGWSPERIAAQKVDSPPSLFGKDSELWTVSIVAKCGKANVQHQQQQFLAVSFGFTLNWGVDSPKVGGVYEVLSARRVHLRVCPKLLHLFKRSR